MISKKLDRILVNDSWLRLFPNSLGVFGDPGISDHSPCCVFLDTTRPKAKAPFKFFSMLNDNPDFAPLIAECWSSLPFHGTMMLRVSEKLKELKSIIRAFSQENYSGIEQRVTEAFEELSRWQQNVLSSPTPTASLNERIAHDKWVNLARAEESFFFQRSRVTWLDKGDANTTFYHRQVRTRLYQNQVIFLQDDYGNVVNSKEDIMNLVVSYYENLFGGVSPSTDSSLEDLSQLISYRCSPSVKESLEAPFTSLDIQSAFFSLPRNKAPGPDGYPAEFFTHHWKAVGPDLIMAIQEFFSPGKMLQQWNATILTLIPKKKNAVLVSDFRPISCCNTVYKVISKLLANRLKQILPSVISNTQSAFIPGRLLVENVLMGTELIQGYNWKNISKRSLLKVDL